MSVDCGWDRFTDRTVNMVGVNDIIRARLAFGRITQYVADAILV